MSTLVRERPPLVAARDGFGRLVHAEWTKFRTVPGWVAAMLVAVLLILGFGLSPGMTGTCGQQGQGSECSLPVGPDGEQVTDVFTFAHQSLTGDGSLTARVSSLTGQIPTDNGEGKRSGLAPWAKAGLILKANTRPGSTYAAIMVTGRHGVRMQDDYLHDRAGRPGAVVVANPRWLRLTRKGATVTGAESTDGTHWTTVGTAHLDGLGSTVQAGMFTTSPQFVQAQGAGGAFSGSTQATAGFDHLGRAGSWAAGNWTTTQVGRVDPTAGPVRVGVQSTANGFALTGSGDIAPAVVGAAGLGTSITQTLLGTFIGLILVAVVGTMFLTAEYRRGLVRTTLTAAPRRGSVLAAKAVVVGGVSFVTGLVAAAVVVTFGQRVLRANGVYVQPASLLTEVRVVVGTAALLAVAAVLALAIGALLRRGAAAVAVSVVVIVLPYLLAVSVLPVAAGAWVLRVSPAAAFAVQQSVEQYPQVDNVYTAVNGYFPLPPWAGFAVLCAWAGLALALAALLLRRRDA